MTEPNGMPEGMQALMEQLGPLMELGQRLQLQKDPVTDAKKILIRRDRKTGKRIPESMTTVSGIGITFKPLTEGERRSYADLCEGKTFIDWPAEEQVRLLNENLLTPDFKAEADGDLTVEWVADNFDWQAFLEIGTAIMIGSRADHRVPRLSSSGKKGRGRRTGSKARSSTRSSTKKATRTRANGASTTSS